jgi:uncharacterized protein
MDLTVTDAPDRHRFEAWADGKLAGFAQYIRRDDLVVLTHTEVDPAFEGHGVGGVLARVALDDALARNLPVRAQCPFIADWIARNPDYEHALETARDGGERPT